MSDWKRREIKEKKRREYRDSRISGDHELTGTRHRQPHRDQDIRLSWNQDKSGKYHVTPSSVPVGGGINISEEDWDEIFRDKSGDIQVLDAPPLWKGKRPLSDEEAARTDFPYPREPQWEESDEDGTTGTSGEVGLSSTGGEVRDEGDNSPTPG